MNKLFFTIGIFSIPALAQAASDLFSFIDVVAEIMGFLVSIFLMLAFVVFFYGLAVFIFNAGDEKKRDEGKQWMSWSIIALFVLVTIWGIIGLLQNTVGNIDGPGKVDIIIPRF